MTSFWISSARAMVALFLGIALLLQEDKTRPFLINFMGVYWLASGGALLRSMLTEGQARRPLSIVAATAGLATGVGALLYSHFSGGPTTAIVIILGLAIVLIGVLHVLGGFESAAAHHGLVRPLVPLGLVEAILGTMLLCSPLFKTQVTYWAASLWASLAGTILMLDALRIRARVRRSRGDKTTGARSVNT